MSARDESPTLNSNAAAAPARRLMESKSGSDLALPPLLVALHWVIALLTIAALALGALVMVKIPNGDPMRSRRYEAT